MDQHPDDRRQQAIARARELAESSDALLADMDERRARNQAGLEPVPRTLAPHERELGPGCEWVPKRQHTEPAASRRVGANWQANWHSRPSTVKRTTVTKTDSRGRIVQFEQEDVAAPDRSARPTDTSGAVTKAWVEARFAAFIKAYAAHEAEQMKAIQAALHRRATTENRDNLQLQLAQMSQDLTALESRFSARLAALEGRSGTVDDGQVLDMRSALRRHHDR